MRPHQRSQCCGHDRNPGCLHRRRVHDRSNRRVILSLIRRHLLAEELTHDFDVLAKPGNSLRVLPVRQTDHLSPRLSRQAGTQSQIQSPIGHLIHSDCLMSQDPWIPQRNLCHVAGKTNCRRLDRRRSEKCPALHPRRQGGWPNRRIGRARPRRQSQVPLSGALDLGTLSTPAPEES